MGDRQAFPLCPLDTLTPFLSRAAALHPGLGVEGCTTKGNRTLIGRGDDTARGLG